MTSFQTTVRSRLALNSTNWRGLTAAQRLAWAALGGQIIRLDTLGVSYDLTGQQAFVSVNNNLRAAGIAAVTDAPAYTPPADLISATLTAASALGGSLSLAYTTTPLAAGSKMLIFASPAVSPGINFVPRSRFKLVLVTAAAAASPADILAGWQSRFGTFPVGAGQKIFVQAVVIGSTGLPTTRASAFAIVS